MIFFIYFRTFVLFGIFRAISGIQVFLSAWIRSRSSIPVLGAGLFCEPLSVSLVYCMFFFVSQDMLMYTLVYTNLV